MSTQPEPPVRGQPAPPKTRPSTAESRSSAPPRESSHPTRAESALKECVGAISLVDVTVHSLESQQIAAPEQEVLNRAIRALWSVHDWIYDRMWPDTAAEPGRDREAQP
jgi:hypothetical protein